MAANTESVHLLSPSVLMFMPSVRAPGCLLHKLLETKMSSRQKIPNALPAIQSVDDQQTAMLKISNGQSYVI
jgi:hypothetical protein